MTGRIPGGPLNRSADADTFESVREGRFTSIGSRRTRPAPAPPTSGRLRGAHGLAGGAAGSRCDLVELFPPTHHAGAAGGTGAAIGVPLKLFLAPQSIVTVVDPPSGMGTANGEHHDPQAR